MGKRKRNRFVSTLEDLEHCRDHLSDKDLSSEEKGTREELIRCCMGFLEDLGMEVNDTTSDYVLGR